MDLYHCMNRGTDKRSIALDTTDRLRFVADLYAMNDASPVLNFGRDRLRDLIDLGGQSDDERERLVTVHAWCLMGNHYHLLLEEHVEGGMSTFLMKLNVAYTKYFNERRERSGVLFQGKTKRVHIETDRQYLYILPYIHLNPLDLLKGTEEWRRRCPARPAAALDWVTKYRWSSFRNYVGEKEFAPILHGSDFFKERRSHVDVLQKFLKTAHAEELGALALE